jgi:dsRNA-specific ribonuclease
MPDLNQREQAWIGDSVLALFAREWILKQTNLTPSERSEVFIQMTSNKFLASLGQPTKMEAEIGAVYRAEGLEAAFKFIDCKFVPVFKKQRINKAKASHFRTAKKSK